MLEVDIFLKLPENIYRAIMEFIILLLVVEVELGLKRPATITIAIVEQELMIPGEVYIGLRPTTINPTTQVAMVYC